MSEKLKIIKYAPPPTDLPIYSQVDPREVSFFGRTNYESEFESKKYIFGIKKNDRRRHLYMIGKSGVGKSKLMELLIRQDIVNDYGLCLLDSRGDIIEDILDFIPEERIKDVVLIDLTDINYPISFNFFKNVAPEMKYQTAQIMVKIMKRQFNANWNLYIEHISRFVCLALLDYPEATMHGMILMLTDESYRKKVIEHIKDELIRNFWEIEFSEWLVKFNNEAIMPLINKLSQIFSNPLLCRIFKQQENRIDIGKMINENKIILVNLSKSKLGEDGVNFLGSILISKIHQTGIARAAMRELGKKDFHLYIDEFQNVAMEDFVNIFTEARKYGLALVVSHQYLTQIKPEILAAVLNNVGTIVVFRLGGDDAFVLEKEMTPVFKAKDMINLGMREFYIKMTIDGNTADPFSAETLKVLPPTHPSYKNKIMEFNRQNYCVVARDNL